jgi:hypothetical protein
MRGLIGDPTAAEHYRIKKRGGISPSRRQAAGADRGIDTGLGEGAARGVRVLRIGLPCHLGRPPLLVATRLPQFPPVSSPTSWLQLQFPRRGDDDVEIIVKFSISVLVLGKILTDPDVAFHRVAR